ncbi:MAG: hypothetical protein NTZ74_07960 [Chloroflexi bacterium]|nr:hypothetical protein [Chloroflexota bacterium]
MSENKYLPFKAINEFMRDDFRLTVIQEVFTGLNDCSPTQKQIINRMVEKRVQVPGFRNGRLAPLAIKVKHSASLFEQSSEFSSIIIECWSNFHKDLKMMIFDLLTEKNWQPNTIDLDRTSLPGFMIEWPKQDTFELLIKSIRESRPDLQESEDNISLMVVWVGNRLPYDLYDEES